MLFFDTTELKRRNAAEKFLLDYRAAVMPSMPVVDAKPNTLQILLDNCRAIDASRFPATYGCPPGIVLVEMLPESNHVGEILLPDVVAGKCRPDVAVVLCTGPDISLPVGSLVAVRPYDGQWIDGFETPGYRTRNQVRVIGRYAPFKGEIERLAWDETICLQFVGDEYDMVATGRKLIIRRDAVIGQDRGIDLPDSAKYRTGMATILSVGPDADLLTRVGHCQVGDRICYSSQGLVDVEFQGDPDLAIIDDVAVSLLIRQEDAHG